MSSLFPSRSHDLTSQGYLARFTVPAQVPSIYWTLSQIRQLLATPLSATTVPFGDILPYWSFLWLIGITTG